MNGTIQQLSGESHMALAPLAGFASVEAMIAARRPSEPVYCLYPAVQRAVARRFLEGFPGRVLYAVKANADAHVIRALWDAGVRHFDTASLAEIELVKELLPEAQCYFMAPARLIGAAQAAHRRHGVTTFVVDCASELEALLGETGGGQGLTIFVRLATPAPEAMYDLSTKFGATREEGVALLKAVAASGATPALAFNVGSLVLQPSAYGDALAFCAQVLKDCGLPIGLLDVGGGFPSGYPGLDPAPLEAFFQAIAQARAQLPLAPDAELLGEPGRALVAEGLSLVTQVVQRKEGSITLNDGIYGSISEPAISKGQVMFPTRTYRAEGALADATRPLKIYGPTCDSLDALPEPFTLPGDITRGDWIEFGLMGAYTISMRTRFNGFHPEAMVEIADPAALPPGVGD
ncbi:MAG: type III PLP-dependent enzyme [Pseudomonadota bacterium]